MFFLVKIYHYLLKWEQTHKSMHPEYVTVIISFSLFMNPEATLIPHENDLLNIVSSHEAFKHGIENKRKQRMYP